MSFSAEMKDFLAGFQAGARVGGDIQDRKLRKEQEAFERQFRTDDFSFRKERALKDDAKDDRRFALDESKFGYQQKRDSKDDEWKGVDVGLRREALELQKAGQAADDARGDRALDIQESGQVAADKRGNRALDIRETERAGRDAESLLPDTTSTPGDEFDYFEEGDEEGSYRRGGLVLHAEDGAPVEAAIPEEPEAPQVASGKGSLPPVVRRAAEISGEVLDEMVAETADDAGAISTSKKPIKDRLVSVRPASPDAIKEIDKVIDPRGEIPNHKKGAERLVKAYDFFVSKGETGKAKKIAGEIVRNYHETSKTLGKLALTAIEQGNLPAASKLIAGAYESVPDGGEMKLNPTANGTIAYKIDREGYAAEVGEASAQQVYALAAQVADGSAFIDRMENLVGTARTTSESKGGKGAKKGSYSGAVRDAATAIRELNGIAKQLENFDPIALGIDTSDEEGQKQADAARAEIEAKYSAAQQRAEKARAFAEFAEKKTGRKAGSSMTDIKNELGMGPKTAPAIPEKAPAKPVPEAFKAEIKKQIDAGKDPEAIRSKLESMGYSTEGF